MAVMAAAPATTGAPRESDCPPMRGEAGRMEAVTARWLSEALRRGEEGDHDGW